MYATILAITKERLLTKLGSSSATSDAGTGGKIIKLRKCYCSLKCTYERKPHRETGMSFMLVTCMATKEQHYIHIIVGITASNDRVKAKKRWYMDSPLLVRAAYTQPSLCHRKMALSHGVAHPCVYDVVCRYTNNAGAEKGIQRVH